MAEGRGVAGSGARHDDDLGFTGKAGEKTETLRLLLLRFSSSSLSLSISSTPPRALSSKSEGQALFPYMI